MEEVAYTRRGQNVARPIKNWFIWFTMDTDEENIKNIVLSFALV